MKKTLLTILCLILFLNGSIFAEEPKKKDVNHLFFVEFPIPIPQEKNFLSNTSSVLLDAIFKPFLAYGYVIKDSPFMVLGGTNRVSELITRNIYNKRFLNREVSVRDFSTVDFILLSYRTSSGFAPFVGVNYLNINLRGKNVNIKNQGFTPSMGIAYILNNRFTFLASYSMPFGPLKNTYGSLALILAINFFSI